MLEFLKSLKIMIGVSFGKNRINWFDAKKRFPCNGIRKRQT